MSRHVGRELLDDDDGGDDDGGGYRGSGDDDGGDDDDGGGYRRSEDDDDDDGGRQVQPRPRPPPPQRPRPSSGEFISPVSDNVHWAWIYRLFFCHSIEGRVTCYCYWEWRDVLRENLPERNVIP